jgi:hypothetical protein
MPVVKLNQFAGSSHNILNISFEKKSGYALNRRKIALDSTGKRASSQFLILKSSSDDR